MPNAFASLLYKTVSTSTKHSSWRREYAVAFQGVKMDEPGMMFYLLNKKPVYWKTNVDGAGAMTTFATTEGYALYTQETFPCIAYMSNTIKEDVSWITGHSLGGAAATLYSMVIDKGRQPSRLVTFGAVATKLGWGSHAPTEFLHWGHCTSKMYEEGKCNSKKT